MYVIYSDNNLVYAPNLSNIEDGGFAVIDPSVTTELNNAGSCSFKIPIINSAYAQIKKMKSIIRVYDERPGYQKRRIFRGRVLYDNADFKNTKDIYAEGALGFFNDSVVRPYSFNGSVSDYFSFLVTQHNAQVDADKQFIVGNCTVTDSNNTIVRSSGVYPSTWQEMKEKLIENLGGYLVPRYEIVNGEEVEYLDYLAESGDQSTQKIVFAENLLDLSQHVDATNVCTVLVPLGAAEENTGVRLTIKSVNDNKDYLESATGIALFGRITHTESWDDVTIASNLKTKGQALLNSGILMAITIDINAFDLHLLDVNTDTIDVGRYNEVISTPHNIDAFFQCAKIKLNLRDPDKSEYTFGATGKTLTGMSNGNAASSSNAANAAGKANAAANATANALNIALTEIAEDYVTKTDYNSLAARVAALEGN